MKKPKRQSLRSEKGITLLALVITIVVLLVLAGVTISSISGENGIISSTINAGEQAKIDKEQEIVNIAATKAMGKHKFGSLTKEGLEEALAEESGNEEIQITDMQGLGFTAIFISGRVYEVRPNGDVTYLGTEQEVAAKVIINTNEEKNTTPELIQEVEVQVRSYVEIEDEDITLIYAWSKSKEEMPEDSEFVAAELTGTKFNRTATIYSDVTDQANYYLWVKAIVTSETGEAIETAKVYGEYAIKEHTTLKICTSEQSSTSTFLGMPIQRNLIKSVTILSDLQGHSKDDGTCYDVSASQKGAILGWYTEEVVDGTTYYNVTIAENGGVVANTNSSHLFRYIGYGVNGEVTIEGLENLDTSNVTDMSNMFNNCNKLTTLDVTSLDTRNVTNMGNIFSSCTNLTSLDISNFKTSKVNSMSAMFSSCSNLKEIIGVNKMDVSKVTDMRWMFTGCKSLTSLYLEGWDTKSVTKMTQIFMNCTSLASLDLNHIDTSNVSQMTMMFAGCTSMENFDLTNFNTSQATTMEGLFGGCTKITSLDLSNFKTNLVGSFRSMFGGSSNLTSLDLSSFVTSSATDMADMFYGCSGLNSINFTGFDTSRVTTMYRMFQGCRNLTTVDLSDFNTSEVINMAEMFYTDINLKTIYVSNLWNTDKVTSGEKIFTNCYALVGAIPFESDKIDVTYANYTSGYLTLKQD